jgi:GNAT superfamily N-acetyltransferase
MAVKCAVFHGLRAGGHGRSNRRLVVGLGRRSRCPPCRSRTRPRAARALRAFFRMATPASWRVDEWRRSGIGRRLLDVMEANAKRAGCARLVVRYKDVNVAAGRCYARPAHRIEADWRLSQHRRGSGSVSSRHTHKSLGSLIGMDESQWCNP